MTQSRGLSAPEVTVNMVVDWLVEFVTQLAVFPAVGLQAAPVPQLVLSHVCTVVLLSRSYLLRHAFGRFG